MRQSRILLGALTLFVVLLTAAILTDFAPLLRGPAPETAEWFWPYALRPLARWWPPILAALLMLSVGGAWLIWRRARWVTAALLMALFVSHITLQLALVYADNPNVKAELINRTLSNLASGYFEPAAEITDIDFLLRHYPALMPSFASDHARTHPPGLILLNWGSIQLFERWPDLSQRLAAEVWPERCTDLWLHSRPAHFAAALGFWSLLPVLVGASAVWPACLLAKRLMGSESSKLATLLVASLPALALFSPKSDQFFAPLTLWMVYFLLRGLPGDGDRIGRLAWLFAAGITLSFMSFLSLGNAALALVAAILLLPSLQTTFRRGESVETIAQPRSQSLSRLARPHLTHLLILAFGAAFIWLLYWLIWGVPPWEVAQVGLDQHYRLVTNLRRYQWWVGWNLVDLMIFAGPVVVFGFGAAVLSIFRPFNWRKISYLHALALSLLLLILLLDLSGTARGEVGRLWLFFMPLLALVAGAWFGGSNASASRPRRVWNLPQVGLLLLALQLGVTVAVGVGWRPVRAVIVVAERPEMATVPDALTAVNQPLGDQIVLAGFEAEVSETAVNLTHVWTAKGPTLRPYIIFNHLVNPQGELVAQADNWAVGGQWPPTCWRAGDTIIDPHQINISHLPPGRYTLYTGMYDSADGQRLATPAGTTEIQLLTVTKE